MLELNSIHKTFNPGDVNEIKALRGIDLTLEVGEFVTVIGSNGAGKSTLLNSVAGVFQPDEGKIYIDNTDVTRWAEHHRARLVGRVFQDPLRGTAASMSIEQNMAIALLRGKRRGLGQGLRRKDRPVFREHLALLGLGLEDRLQSKVGLLSGGQRQSLTLLMATLTKPRVLLLDEHIAALDPATAEQVLQLTNKLVRDYHLTTLMVTHNMSQALSMGTRTLMMHQGQIILDLRGEERARLTVTDLINKFTELRGKGKLDDSIVDDELLLS
ncbi:MAG: ATP-binding cassette domain-containing protein [Chloroflexi bacterium]|uniref:ATP-binding cassette domain-containing protein n=1 Tax=Candidatus Chlorohelix allophototropha TaxID=3003348 RepID=A0A8T7LWV7_9CHLR|nr:ATP-binding cassette domain-containing protein [Chloroflexota bacterium]WJW66580.1 ATP-binding cassette domain-containing protein [Chloroflexota bacterium L227-S17]